MKIITDPAVYDYHAEKGLFIPLDDFCSTPGWKSHTNLTHPGKYFRPSKVKIMRPTSPK